MTTRTARALLAALALTLAGLAAAADAPYPARPVRILVGLSLIPFNICIPL